MTAKPCAECGGKKGPKYARRKYCYRCASVIRRRAADAKHRAAIFKRYKLAPEDYDRMLAAQGGVCAICQRANGRTRRLSVDHDHSCCATTPTCGKCTRGLLCRPCNNILGHARDNREFFNRAISYLEGRLIGRL